MFSPPIPQKKKKFSPPYSQKKSFIYTFHTFFFFFKELNYPTYIDTGENQIQRGAHSYI